MAASDMGLLDVLRRLRHGRPGLRVCPRCGSPRIRRLGGFCGWLLPTTYVCPDCGYKGPIILELEPEEGKEARIARASEEGA